jgi:hypothetical protein
MAGIPSANAGKRKRPLLSSDVDKLSFSLRDCCQPVLAKSAKGQPPVLVREGQ